MKFNKFLMVIVLITFLSIGAVNAEDNMTQNDSGINMDNSSEILDSQDMSIPENGTPDENYKDCTYDNRYYLFRGDCWSVNHNFESSAAVTSKTLSDLTVTGTFRTQNDMVGLYWNSQDPIQHPYISYGTKSDYSDVILEFDYEMEGCMDFSNDAINIIIQANSGETYYIPMNQFIENNHLTLDFNNITLLPGSFFSDKDGQPVTVGQKTKLNVTDLKYVMLMILPDNFVENNAQHTIIENSDFKCEIYNITVANGEICYEQFPLESHQYRLCEGYDDICNLNPLRISKEMRKLGYADWVDLYIGASYFYEKSGVACDVIDDMAFTHNRTEKMILNKDVPLNTAFKSWLDCYSREVKNNGVTNLIISVSMENLQCPQSWRQMDSNGNFAMTGWEPSTFICSPCNEEFVLYMQNVCESCLDIVSQNGLKPILQMGETWWWWTESSLSNQSPCFYDNSTKDRYLSEQGSDLPVYDNVWNSEYDEDVISWLNQQLVSYSDALREVVKGDKYDDGLYMALFFTPSVVDTDRVPPMMRDANYIKDAYSPDKLDVLQIEDYDWVIFENSHHNESYSIGQDLGFDENSLHYFGGFVQNPGDADKYWELIKDSMDDAFENNFGQVFVWAGSQVRRDNKIFGHDEQELLGNLSSTTLTAPAFASVGEKFTITIHTNKWVNGVFNIYDFNEGIKGKLLASSLLTNGYSSIVMSTANVGLNRVYLDFNCTGGEYHLIQEIRIIENSPNISADIPKETETGSDLNISFNGLKNSSGFLHISIDGNDYGQYMVENGEFTKTLSDLPAGYHSISLKYTDEELTDEVYSNTFVVNVGAKTDIAVSNLTTFYNSGENLTMTLKDISGNPLNGKNILINLFGFNYTVTTDEYGQATLEIDLPVGNYTAEMMFEGDNAYLSSYAVADIIVDRAEPFLTAGNINVVYGNNANLVATLKDIGGNILASRNVIINLNNKIYNKSTDAKGQIRLSIGLPAKQYSAKISFAGDSNYQSAFKTVKIIVKKATPKFTAKNKSFKVKTKIKKYTVLLKNNKNKVMKKVKVSIKVKGKTYKATTNSKGKATFKITKLNKKGKYIAVVKYSGSSNYNSVIKKIRITIR
ncbi:MAG: hypothetical protein E7Z81_04390 [Methanobrevibacter sp.]|uniref:Ig-like domain-containing protein n=1 Tax=Methanobrevibacter sp. TaxID=66852 RepID=UPI0025E3D035|nr:Ig-like domain-containing protein [Methanobrevibacter sp.]MBE6497498.1 hypothetical protein [Methanobrevibacter sp.]